MKRFLLILIFSSNTVLAADSTICNNTNQDVYISLMHWRYSILSASTGEVSGWYKLKPGGNGLFNRSCYTWNRRGAHYFTFGVDYKGEVGIANFSIKGANRKHNVSYCVSTGQPFEYSYRSDGQHICPEGTVSVRANVGIEGGTNDVWLTLKGPTSTPLLIRDPVEERRKAELKAKQEAERKAKLKAKQEAQLREKERLQRERAEIEAKKKSEELQIMFLLFFIAIGVVVTAYTVNKKRN